MTRPLGARPRVASPLRATAVSAEAGGELVVGVLGPLAVLVDGQPVEVRAGRLRALLVVLAMSADPAVTVDQLAASMWSEQLPANARRSVQTYVTRLQGLLGASAIGTRPAGYALAVEPDRVDALRFLRLVDCAWQDRDPRAQHTLLAEALGLWRGTPFSDVPSMQLTELESARLIERFLLALERRIDLDMAEGRHLELVAELSELTADHPLRESLWMRLLVVLDHRGRPAEALTRYGTIRARLAEELGVDPSPELARLSPTCWRAGGWRWPTRRFRDRLTARAHRRRRGQYRDSSRPPDCIYRPQ